MKKTITILMGLLMSVPMMADQVWRDEKLDYAMYLGPIKLGEASLGTKNLVRDGKKVVQMDLIARTTSTMEKIFSLNDTLTTIVDPKNSAPVYFRKHCFEEDDIVLEKVNFTTTPDGRCKADMQKVYKDGHVKERSETASSQIYDMISVVGFARAIDTGSLYKGKKFKFKLADACEIIDETLIYQGKETLKISGKKYECNVYRLVEPYVEKGKSRERDILSIYVNDDAQRTIIQMVINFKVGSAKAKIVR